MAVLQRRLQRGVVFDVDSEVDMAGREGTLVFGGQFDVLDAGSLTWTDTVDLQLVGTRGIKATNVVVEVDTNIPGFTDDIFENCRETGRSRSSRARTGC